MPEDKRRDLAHRMAVYAAQVDSIDQNIATPLIAHWPAGISEKGKLRHQPGHVIDIMPTLVELSGEKYPETIGEKDITPMEGRSLLPLFKSDAETPPRDLFWEHMGRKAVRRGDWKAVGFKNDWQLYDLKEDPTELNDLASTNPGKTTELKDLWKAWAERCDVLK